MAETLEAQLDLAIDAALSSIGDLGSAVEDALVAAGDAGAAALGDAISNVPPAVIDADTTAAEDALTAFIGDVEVANPSATLSVDDAEAIGTLDDFAAVADALNPNVTVGVDDQEALNGIASLADAIDSLPLGTVEIDDSSVAAAQDAVDGLGTSLDGAGGSASKASSSFGQATGAAAGLGVATNVLKGEATGATTGLLSMSSAGAGVAGPVGAAAAAVGVLFVSGERMVAGIERMNLVFGQFRSQVESINVGGLSGELSSLAVQSGNSAAALRQSLAALGQVAVASGLTKREAAGVAQQFAALALRATAMNPQLGEAGDVVTGLQRGLATGGRFAAKFGLSLTAAEIAARAMSNTGKTAATDLTLFEKATAGAQIATERLGQHLGTDFSAGIQQSAVKFKALEASFKAVIAALGAPLIAPAVDIAQALGPILKLAGALTALQLPVIALKIGFQILGAIASAIAPIIDTISGAAQEAVTWITDLVQTVLEFVGGEILSGIEQVGQGFVDFAGFVSSAFDDVVSFLSDFVSGFEDAFSAVASVVESAVSPVVDAIGSMNDALSSIVGPIGDVVDAVGGLFGGIGGGLDVVDQLVSKIADLGPAAMAKFARSIDDPKQALGLLKAVLKENETAGGQFGQALLSAGVITETQFNKAMGNSVTALGQHKKALQDAAVAQKAFDDSLSGLVVSDFKLPTLGAEAQKFAQDWSKSFGDATLSFPAFVQSLTDSAAQTQTVFDGIKNFAAVGLGGIAAVLAAAGPELGAKYLASLQQGNFDGATLQELNKAIIAAEVQKAAMEAVMQSYGPALVTAFQQGGFAGLDAKVQEITSSISTGIDAGKPGAAAAGTGVGQVAEGAFTTAFGVAPQKAGEILARTVAEGTRHTGEMHTAGLALGQGFANGISESALSAVAAASSLAIAAAGGAATGIFAWVAGGLASGAAYAGGIISSIGIAAGAGLALTVAAAAATRNTGLFQASGQAMVGGYAAGLHAVGPAVGAAVALVGAAAGATRNTGLFAAAGSAAAAAYAGGISSGANAAVNAARNMAVAAVNAAKTAGSPTEHLWADMASVQVNAYADALVANLNGVKGGVRGVLGAPGLPLAPAGLGGAKAGAAPAVIQIDTVRVEIIGVSDPVLARQAGDAAAGGFVDGLTRRKVVLAARGGG